MSETLVLVFAGADLVVADLARPLRILGDVHKRKRGLVVEAGADACFIVPVDDPSVDGIFNDSPPGLLPSGRVSIYSLDYKSASLAVRAVHTLAATYRLIVDTNYRLVLPGIELTREILARGHPDA